MCTCTSFLSVEFLHVVADYVDDLMQEMVNLCNKPRAERPTPLEEPATPAAGMDRLDKAEAVKASTSRFKAK